jgi:hypothetical protein
MQRTKAGNLTRVTKLVHVRRMRVETDTTSSVYLVVQRALNLPVVTTFSE